MGFFDFLKKKKDQNDIIEPQETISGLKNDEKGENVGKVTSVETSIGNSKEVNGIGKSAKVEENPIETTDNDSGGDSGGADTD